MVVLYLEEWLPCWGPGMGWNFETIKLESFRAGTTLFSFVNYAEIVQHRDLSIAQHPFLMDLCWSFRLYNRVFFGKVLATVRNSVQNSDIHQKYSAWWASVCVCLDHPNLMESLTPKTCTTSMWSAPWKPLAKDGWSWQPHRDLDLEALRASTVDSTW